MDDGSWDTALATNVPTCRLTAELDIPIHASPTGAWMDSTGTEVPTEVLSAGDAGDHHRRACGASPHRVSVQSSGGRVRLLLIAINVSIVALDRG